LLFVEIFMTIEMLAGLLSYGTGPDGLTWDRDWTAPGSIAVVRRCRCPGQSGDRFACLTKSFCDVFVALDKLRVTTGAVCET